MANDNKEEIEGTKKAAEELTASMGQMTAQMSEFYKVLADVSEKAKENTKTLSEEMSDAAKNAGMAAGATDDFEKVLQNLNKTTKTGGKGLNRFQSGLEDGMKKAMKFNLGLSLINGTLASLKSSFGLITSLISGSLSMIQGFIGLMDTLWTGLLDAAVDYANGNTALQQAMENVRKEFGDLATNEGQQVMQMYKSLNKTQSTLASTGRSVWYTFGDQAEQLQFVTEVATAAGKAMTRFGAEIADSLPEIALMNKSLGISNEALTDMVVWSVRDGDRPRETFENLAVAVAHMSKTFGVSAKMIGKNFEEMWKDGDTFGHLTTQAMASVATYAAKLNVEIATLKGLMDTFDTFEGAATSAGKLNEVLGIQIDTMKMINADNPAERMDMLRRAFEDTGKSVSDLSRFELKALSDAMGGMPIDDLRNSLSMSTDDVNFAEIADEAAEAQKKMSPVEAMNELSKNIEKLIKGSELVKGGFFANFIGGIETAIDRSGSFREFMSYITKQLRAVRNAGRVVGQTFSIIFSEKGPLGNLIKLYKQMIDFSTENTPGWKFLDSIKKAAESLMKALETDPKQALRKFFGSLKKAWKEYTKAQSPVVQDLMAGFKDLFINAVQFLVDEAPAIIQELGLFLEEVASGLESAFGPGGAVDQVQDPLMRAFSDLFVNVFNSLMEFVIPPLLRVLGLIGNFILEKAMPIFKYVFMALFVKAIITSLLQAVVFAGVQKAIQFATGTLGKSIEASQKKGVEESSGMVEAAGGFGEKLKGASEKMGDLGEALKAAAKIATFVTVGIAMVLVGLAVLVGVATATGLFDNSKKVAELLAVLGLIIIESIGVIHALDMASKLDQDKALKGAGVLAASFVGLLVFGALSGLFYAAMKDVDAPKLLILMGATLLLVLSAASLTLAAAGFGLVADKAMTPALIGLVVIGIVLALLVATIPMALRHLDESMKGLDVGRISGAIAGMVALLTVTITVITAAAAVGAVMMMGFGLGAAAIITGLITVGLVFNALIDTFAGDGTNPGVLQRINDIPVTNASGLRSKVNLIEKLVGMMGDIGGLALDAAGIAAEMSSSWNPFSNSSGSFVKVMNSISGFLDSIKDALVDTLEVVVKLVREFRSYTPEQLEKAGVIATIIGAVGQLAGAMASPLTEIGKVAVISEGTAAEAAQKMRSTKAAMSQIFSLFAGSESDPASGIGGMIRRVIKIADGLGINKKEIKMAKDKVGIVASAINAIAALSSGVASLMSAARVEDVTEFKGLDDAGIGTGDYDKTIKTTRFDIGPMQSIFNKLDKIISKGNISSLVNMVISEGQRIKPIKKETLENIKQGYSSLADFIGVIKTTFADSNAEELGKIYTNAEMLATKMESKKGPVHVIKALLAEGNAIMAEVNKAAGAVNVDLISKANGILGLAEKDGEITIRSEKLVVNLALTVNIETKEIATALEKGYGGKKAVYELNPNYKFNSKTGFVEGV